MAIRLRPDDNGGGNFNNDNNRGGRGGGNGGAAIIMAILMLVFRYPKYSIPIILIGGFIYFMTVDNDSASSKDDIFSMGCDIDQEKYDKTLVYPALAASSSKYSIPSKASLRKFAPERRNQGQQGSCVGWASAYAARTILESVATGSNPNSTTYSPSFLYNQIGLRGCQGAYTGEALEHMKRKGLLHFSKFPYDPNSCTKQPSSSQLQEAMRHRIRGYNRLTQSGRNYDVDLEAVKQNIAQGAPVIIAMKVPYSFQDMIGKKVWKPTRSEARRVNSHGGHAMCLVGFDDNKQMFEIMNSWGSDWGDRGFVWVAYDDFKTFCREAYGVFPHGKAKTASATEFAIDCGLMLSKSQRNVPIRRVRGNLFETTSPMTKNTGFKLEITNSLECYAYVFSKEADADGGAALTVFPPSPKYSTFLGIIGTRLFPRTQEFYPDDRGDKDYMAIVFSKKELNPEEIRQGIDNANRGNFYDNVMAAVGSRAFKQLNYKNKSNLVSFEQKANSRQDVAVVVIAVDKQ